jgi:regulator of sigma E protease
MLILQTLLAFIVVIGILVTVHEFGHYWVAKRLGVKILRFSIGFGQPLWKKRFGTDQTEFVIAAIPLGGYVKMLGEESSEEIASEDLPRAFNRQSLKVRTAIVFAGPLFNFLLAIIVYTAMYMIGVTGFKALVGDVTPQSLASTAQFQKGDEIVAVNGQPAIRWESVLQATLHQLLTDEKEVSYSIIDEKGYQRDLSLDLQDVTLDDFADGQFFKKLGIKPLTTSSSWPAIMGEIMSNSAADLAGLQRGDKIIALDNQTINDWKAWALYVSQRPSQEIYAEIERNHQIINLTLIPDDINGVGRIGVYAPYIVTERYNLWPAFIQGMTKTWEVSVLTLQIMAKMLTLQVSHKHISGPITIAQVAGQSARIGIDAFLSFLGLVSVSLAVINLFPLLPLDGGHLLMYLIEGIKGNPVTEKTREFLLWIGLVLVIGLMGLAIINDFVRLLS